MRVFLEWVSIPLGRYGGKFGFRVSIGNIFLPKVSCFPRLDVIIFTRNKSSRSLNGRTPYAAWNEATIWDEGPSGQVTGMEIAEALPKIKATELSVSAIPHIPVQSHRNMSCQYHTAFTLQPHPVNTPTHPSAVSGARRSYSGIYPVILLLATSLARGS